MHTTNTPKSVLSLIIAMFVQAYTLLEKVICMAASFPHESYKQLSGGSAKAMVAGRGISVFIPSIIVFFTLHEYGTAIFGETSAILFQFLIPPTFFIMDLMLIAKSYTVEDFPKEIKRIRYVMIIMSFAINIYVVAGNNSGILLDNIENTIRNSPDVTYRLDDLKKQEALNGSEREALLQKVKDAETAKLRKYKLETQKKAEIAGATLTDGIKRLRGDGTRAKGFDIELQEAAMIVEEGAMSETKYEAALAEQENLKKERIQLEQEIQERIGKRKTAGEMVCILFKQVFSNFSVFLSAGTLLFFLATMDLIALMVAHVKAPDEVIILARQRSELDMAKAALIHEDQLKKINAMRPPVAIRISAESRPVRRDDRAFTIRKNGQTTPGTRHDEQKMNGRRAS